MPRSRSWIGFIPAIWRRVIARYDELKPRLATTEARGGRSCRIKPRSPPFFATRFIEERAVFPRHRSAGISAGILDLVGRFDPWISLTRERNPWSWSRR